MWYTKMDTNHFHQHKHLKVVTQKFNNKSYSVLRTHSTFFESASGEINNKI